MKRILAVHLLNDRSGSPLVLRNALEALVADGYHVDLLTGTPAGQSGFLSHLPGVTTHALPYRWTPNRWRTLLNFAWVQVLLFVKVLRLATPATVVYINSLLPCGAALAAKCLGARVVYHLHEVSIRPALLKRMLCAVVNFTATRAVFVSHYVKETLQLRVPQQQVIYNALSASFVVTAQRQLAPTSQAFVVLMACSLKDYKGVPEFVQLARTMPTLQFELVLNAPEAQVKQFCTEQALPTNLGVFASTSDMHPFYQRASVVVNLSRPSEWVETFGMTILEAMQYGKPVIVPPVGGVSEVNQVEQTGFAIDGRDLPALQTALELLHHSPPIYARMAEACRRRAADFAPRCFTEQVQHCFRTELAFTPYAAFTQQPKAATHAA